MTADGHELERLRCEMRALTDTAKTLTAPLSLPDLLRALMTRLANILEPAQIGVVFLWDQSAGLFRPAASFGCKRATLREIGLRAGEAVIGEAHDTGETRLASTPEAVDAALAGLRPANRSAWETALGSLGRLAAVPLRAGDNRFGVLVIAARPGVTEFVNLPFVHILADLITLAIDRARLEADAAAIRDARHAERLRSEVMATLSHELRTPLAAIKGYSTALLLDDVAWSETQRREFLELIDSECESLQTMITDLLDSSLIDVGHLTIEPQPVRLPRLAGEIVEEMQRRTDLHRMIVDFPGDFPLLDADPQWIRQVFRNIIDNAIKYSPEGGLIVVKGEVRPHDVVISVIDQGIGISPEDLIPLFEKYFRAKAPTGYHIAGTGLGLPVVRAIVEAHGGRIWVESKVGYGTTLYFSLPLGISAGEQA